MLKNTWISRTKQSWKIVVFGALMSIVIVLIIGFVWLIYSSNDDNATFWSFDGFELAMSFISLGAIAIGILWFSIRCPICGAYVGAHILKTSSVNAWLADLLTLESCPSCGEAGDRRDLNT